MENLEQIINKPYKKKGFFRRARNLLGGALLTTALLFGSYACSKDEKPPIILPPVDTTAPADVSNFTATAGNELIDLTWMNPSDLDFAGVLIRRKTASFPANPTDGTQVYQGTAQAHTDSGLTAGTTYRYRIFSFDEVPNYSSGATASAVPSGASPAGSAIGWIGGGSNGWKTTSGTNSGSDYQSFDNPFSVFVDGSGDIYVADERNSRISKWDSNGNAIGWIGGGSNGWKTTSGTTIGTDYQSFKWPNDVFVDSSGNIYVSDTYNARVSKWDSSGNAIGWIGGGSNGWQTGSAPWSGTGDKQFDSLADLFVDSGGDIYVADASNNRISKWDSLGNVVGWIGGSSNGWKTGSGTGSGSDYQSFDWSISVFIKSANIYIGDRFNNRISKWDSSGNAIGWIGGGSNGWKTTSGTSSGTDYQRFDFNTGANVFVNGSGNIYIADTDNHRISKWDSSGNAIGWIGGGSNGWKTGSGTSLGSDYQSFQGPKGVFIDNNGNIYIVDRHNHRISKWKD